ncbi:MAG: LysR family transcriptional regulator [Deltaproteobacteria bacterium]|jgi:DNA-binding transcriptional LysR family regulator|nr:LysR family transcriptional regulator [Deltaproteobacteria bacterium]|tara:strand:- start:2258 stop:3145 length:888 start_codon:yes stop_codon:yes gene_type:complete
MNFTLDQLLALDAIARTGSFASAASELHKVPSAVSYSIQGLESALGVDVFDRSRRKAVLTPAGQRLLDASREVLDQARMLERVAFQLHDGWEPELHVVVDGALPMNAIIRCIRRFSDPDVPTALRLNVEYQEGVVDRFEESKGDLALVIGFDGNGDDDGYDCTPLADLELLLVASPEHPLASEVVTAENRKEHAELVVRDSSPRFDRRSKASFMGNTNVVFLSDFHSKRIALVEAAGYGWIPRHFIEDDLREGRLVVLEAETSTWTYSPQIVVRKGHSLGRAGQLFLDTMHSVAT